MSQPRSDNPGTDARPRGRRVVRRVLMGVAFIVGLIAARSLVNLVAPIEPDGTAANKLAAFEEIADDVELLYFGSSHVFRDIDPAAVEVRLQDHGLEVSTHNLGVPGTKALESREFVRTVLESKPESLRWIVLEPVTIEALANESNLRADRVVAWHGLGNTVTALRQLRVTDGLGSSTDAVWGHVVSWLDNAVGTGAVLRRLEASAELDSGYVLDIGEDADGFMPLDVAGPEARRVGNWLEERSITERRETFLLEGPAAFDRWLRNLTAEAAEGGEVSDVEREYLEEIIALAEANDVRVIFLAAPGKDYATAWLDAAASQGVVDDYVDLVDPALVPGIYAFDLWFDRAHLNSRGAQVLSVELADAIAPIIAADLGVDTVKPPEPTEPEVDWRLMATGFEATDGTLEKLNRDAWIDIPFEFAGKLLAVEFGDAVTLPAGQMEALAQGSRVWQPVGPEIAVRGGGWAIFEIPSDLARLRLVGRAGADVRRIVVLERTGPEVWGGSGADADGSALIKSKHVATLVPPDGSAVVALLFGERQGRPGVRVDVIDASGEVIAEGGVQGATTGEWTVVVLPTADEVPAGASIVIEFRGAAGQRIEALAVGF